MVTCDPCKGSDDGDRVGDVNDAFGNEDLQERGIKVGQCVSTIVHFRLRTVIPPRSAVACIAVYLCLPCNRWSHSSNRAGPSAPA